MRRLLALLLGIIMLLMPAAEAAMLLEYNGQQHNYTGSVYKLKVNGEYVKTPLEPIIFNDRALVPVREVFEAMGAEVGYESTTREITVTMNDMFVLMQIDSPYVFINGTRKTIPDGVTPMLIAKAGESAKTMVPVRFVSESLSMYVLFDGEKGEISVSNPGQNIPEPTATPKPYTTTINSVSAALSGNNVTITVKMKAKPDKITELVMLDSGVLYCDIYGANYTVANSTSVNKGAVKAVRMGLHDEYTRVAIDTSGAKSYTKNISSDGLTLTITVTGTSSQSGSTSEPSTSPSATPSPTKTPDSFLTGEKIIVIDAGHGGSDPGAQSSFDGTKYIEKNINLAVAKKVRDILAANGVNVQMTRSGDTYPTLTDRSDLANELGAAMFISIHSNAIENNEGVSGIEVFYSSTNNSDRYGITSKELATDIYKNLIKNTQASERGVKTEQHVVTRTCQMPAVLVELGFITNKEEAKKLMDSSYQDLLASAIASAALDNLSSIKIPPDAQ